MSDPTPEEVLQTTPNPDVIKKLMEEQAATINAGRAVIDLINRLKGMVDMMTGNNPFLGLAVTSQLALFYDEALRGSLKISNNPQPPADEFEVTPGFALGCPEMSKNKAQETEPTNG